MRRHLLISFLFLAAVVAVSAGTCWYLLHDEAFLKSHLSTYVFKHTGRKLSVKGPLTLDLGRNTTIEAREIHFADAAWTDQADMVTIGRLLVTIDLPSLFGNKTVFPAFELNDCAVSLERNDAGEANWDVLPKTGTKPKQDTPPRTDLPVWFQDIDINRCALKISSERLDHPLDIKVTGLAMQHHDDNRWESKGSGSVNNAALSLDGWFAPFSAIVLGGPLEHEFKFSLGDILTLQSSGSVQDAKTWAGADVTAELQGPDIAVFLDEFELPKFSDGAFDFKLQLNSEGQMTQLNVDGDLGSLDVKAQGELDRLIKPSSGNLELSVDGPNLGALAKIFGIDGIVEDAFSHNANAAFESDKIHFNKTTLATEKDHLEVSGHLGTGPGFPGTELKIHFDTDQAERWGQPFGPENQVTGPVNLDGKVSSNDNGLISLQSNITHLESRLDVDGTLGHLPGAIEPELEITFKSPDPKLLAAMAGLKNFPAAPLAVQGLFGLKDRQLKFSKVNVDLAGNRANLDGVLNLNDRYAGSDINLAVDIKNAWEFGRLFGQDGLPQQPVKLTAELKPDGKGLAFQVNDGNLGEIQIELDGRIADLEHPLRMDGNFDVNLPRLSDVSFLFPEMELPDSPFTARGKVDSKGKQVLVEKVTVNLGGSHANIDGNINRVDRYVGSRLNFNLDVKNIAEIGRMFGKDDFPNQPLQLTATITPAGSGLEFKISDGNLGEIQLDLEGRITDLEKPTAVDATFDVKLPRLSDIEFLFPGRDLPDVPFSTSGRLKNGQTRTQLEQVQLKLGRIVASVDGDLLHDSSFDLAVKASGPDAAVLDKLIRNTLPAEPFSVSSGLSGSASAFELKDLDVMLGKSQVKADLAVGLGAVKKIRGSISSSYLDISHWYQGQERENAAQEKGKSKWMFDDTPLKTFTDHGLDIDLNIDVKELYLGNTSFLDISLGVLFVDQLLELKPFTFTGTLGGSYDGLVRLDGHGPKPSVQFEVHGHDLHLGLAAAPGQDPSTYPPIDFDVVLSGTGTTRREVASSLNGKWRVYQGSGEIASAGLNLLFSDFLTQLFTTLNPFAKNSKFTQLDCSVIAAEVVAGDVKVFPVIFQTKQLTILNEGTIDLKTEKIDLSFTTKPRTGLGLTAGSLINSFIKVGGRLTAPAVELDPAGTIAGGGIAVATLGISVLAKSMSNRFLSSRDPCGDARKELAKQDGASN